MNLDDFDRSYHQDPDAFKALHQGETIPVYVPRISRVKRAARDIAIRSAFTGNNYASLAKIYGISQRRVRDIVHRK